MIDGAIENIAPKPSEILAQHADNRFRGTFGWAELEQAARLIVEFCHERGDTWENNVAIDLMSTRDERFGFCGLIAREYLRETVANECLEDECWTFRVTRYFWERLA